MIQCKDCEMFEMDPSGNRRFRCDPFLNIKEPECLQKMQILRLDILISIYRGMSAWQEKMGPLQDKLIRYFKREIEDLDESENWKIGPDEEDDDSEEPLF